MAIHHLEVSYCTSRLSLPRNFLKVVFPFSRGLIIMHTFRLTCGETCNNDTVCRSTQIWRHNNLFSKRDRQNGRHPIALTQGSKRDLISPFEFLRYNTNQYLHIQIPPDRLRRSHMMQYCWGYCELEYLWGYFEGTLLLLRAWYSCHSSCSVPSKYPQRYSNLQ